MSYEQLLIDFGIHYQTEGHKHCRPGWANMACPFCSGNPGYHLGMELETGRFYCWRCGFHPPRQALSKLLGLNEKQANELLNKYKVVGKRISRKQDHRIKFKPHKLPSDCSPMNYRHRKYLMNRNFDPDKLEKEWNLLGTGPMARLDGISYKHRILAPIYWNGKQVTFQTRDITNKSEVKYLACPKEREDIHHKHILYGKQEAWNEVGIAVEGITDVWRLGPLAFATFGIEFTLEQVFCIMDNFKKVIILFDDDPQAKKQARLLASKLKSVFIKTHIETITGDPAELPQDDADHLVNELVKTVY